jgi:hypothetical protein
MPKTASVVIIIMPYAKKLRQRGDLVKYQGRSKRRWILSNQAGGSGSGGWFRDRAKSGCIKHLRTPGLGKKKPDAAKRRVMKFQLELSLFVAVLGAGRKLFRLLFGSFLEFLDARPKPFGQIRQSASAEKKQHNHKD